jgi:hypothetical protein
MNIAKKSNSIFELIDSEYFRKRPAMYLGEKSISRLKLYMDGYQMCEYINDIKSDTEPPFWLFYEWIVRYYKHNGSYYNWDGVILLNYENDEEKSVDIFFERFDEFRTFRPQSILSVETNEENIQFALSKNAGLRRLPRGVTDLNAPNDKLAEQIFIVQYDEGLGVSIHHKWKNEIVVKEYATSLNIALDRLKLEYGKLSEWHEIGQEVFRETYLRINI